jgi:hypothetical protein
MKINPFYFLRSMSWGLFALAMMILIVGIAINLLGIYLTGSLDGWQAWRAESYGHFLAWRLMLYGGIVAGWIPLRRKLLVREPERRSRLLRAEVGFVLVLVLFEVSRAQTNGQWGAA